MAIIVQGKEIAKPIKSQLQKAVTRIEAKVVLHIVYVGSDPVIDSFIRYKKKFGNDIGAKVIVHHFNETISESDLLEAIKKIAAHHQPMIVQLPLPRHLDTDAVVNSVPAELDVDVLGTASRRVFSEKQGLFSPPVTGAIIAIITAYDIQLAKKNIVLLGRGNLVGYPTSLWLKRESYPYHIIEKETDKSLAETALKNADIIISGIGVPGMLTPEMVKDDCMLFDAGTSESGKKIIGDISKDTYEKAALVVPVPGGIGPLTIAMLFQNIINFFSHQ